MRDSTLRCWRGVQNPAVLPAPPTTAMSNVSALSALSPSEHVAPEADSLTVDAPSAQPATPDAVTRNDSNETKTGSAQPDTTPSVPEPRSSRQRGTHEAPTQPRSTPTSPRCAARSSSTHRRRRRNLRPHLPATNPLPQRHLRPRRAPPRRPIRTAPRIRSSRTPRNRSPGRQHLAVKYTV